MITAQNIVTNSQVFRQLSLQSSYIIVLNSPRLTQSLRSLSSRVFNDAGFIGDAIQQLEPFEPLLIDLDGGQIYSTLRLRSFRPTINEIDKIQIFTQNV
jgi:hypothetical protein